MNEKKIRTAVPKIKSVEEVTEEFIRISERKNYKKGDIVADCKFNDGFVWRVLEGSVQLTVYFKAGREYHAQFTKGEWVGLAASLMKERNDVDIVVMAVEDSCVVRVDIDDLLEIGKGTDIWERIARESTREFMKFLDDSIPRVVMSNEEYFMNYLKKNRYEIDFDSTQALSEKLNTNLRTLQRIIKKLRDEGTIKKGRNYIKVVDIKRFEKKLEEKLKERE